jgi:hypothetical protein
MILAVKQYSDMCAVEWLDWVGAVEGPNCRAVVLGKPAAGGRGTVQTCSAAGGELLLKYP